MKLETFSKHLAVASVAIAAGTLSAKPVVSDVTILKSSGSEVKFSYVLSEEPAVVTARFIDATSGEYIPEEVARTFVGAVNRIVQPSATPKEAAWKCAKDWPNRQLNVKLELTAWSQYEPPTYMLVDLASGLTRYFATSNALPVAIGSDASKTTHLILKLVPATGPSGFLLGDNSNPAGCSTVHITRAFYMGVYEFTQGQTHAVFKDSWLPTSLETQIAAKPDLRGDKLPVGGWENYRVRGYGLWPTNDTEGLTVATSHGLISKMRELTGMAFNLPTEAQWEYTCRAGTTGKYYWTPENESAAQKRARVQVYSALPGPVEVGTLIPNDWGFYDMIGNFAEQVLTYYSTSYWTGGGDYVNPRGPLKTNDGNYVSRGYSFTGYFSGTTVYGRTATDGSGYTTGFRLCCNPIPWEDIEEVK